MLLVPVRVGPSAIEGNGALAQVELPPGTPFWRFEEGFDRAFSPSEFERLPAQAQAHLRHFAWVRRDDGHWILSGDLACFMNHAAGEEITCDYFAFDAQAAVKLRPIPPPKS